MNKIIPKGHIFAFFLLWPFFCFSQGIITEQFWEDGEPSFIKTSTDGDIYIGDVVSLFPIPDTSAVDDTLNILLDGVNWVWPRGTLEVNIPEDIDYRTVGGEALYMLTDARAKRVYEINVSRLRETWSYSGPALDWPVDAYLFEENNDDKVIITDKVGNKIIIYNRDNITVEWTYGGQEGSGQNQLSDPMDAVKLPGVNEYIIADKGNDRVIIVKRDSTITWQFGPDSLNSPVDVEYIPSSDEILITDQGNHRVIKVNRGTKRISWQFGTTGLSESGAAGLASPTDADLLTNGHILIADAGNNRIIEIDTTGNIVWNYSEDVTGLRDVDRLPDNQHLAIYLDPDLNEPLPVRLGYEDSQVVSKVYDMNREVNFDKISWQADALPSQTVVELQLRSANTLGDLEAAKWYGPGGLNSYYTESGDSLFPVHDGHRFYQFQAFLKTLDPLYTPVLKNVQIHFHYFNTEIAPHFFSEPIRDSNDNLISSWKTLEFNTILPTDPLKRDKVELEIRIMENKPPYKRLASFLSSKTNPQNRFNLESLSALFGVQEVYLLGFASTNNSSVTPILGDWKIVWDSVPSTESKLRFVDSRGMNVDYYRAATVLPSQEQLVDSLDIILNDPDQPSYLTKIDLTVRAWASGDSEKVELVSQGSGLFRLIPKVPILISETATADNQIMEVMNRDTLSISYQDINNPEDISYDSVFVLQNTTGELTIENAAGQVLTQTSFGDVLFVRVQNEQDRNLNPMVQDSISVEMYDRVTFDEELIICYESQGPGERWDTGEFVSQDGIVVESNNNGIKNDGKLQSLAGHRITVEYLDNVTLLESVLVPGGPDTSVTIYLGGDAYLVEVAPNPFYERRHDNFRLRVASAEGAIEIRTLEIFDLAGEKVREIDGTTLQFDIGRPVPKDRYGIANNWWNLLNDSGHQVSSGTYWLKIHADLFYEDTNTLERVAFVSKFVLVR